MAMQPREAPYSDEIDWPEGLTPFSVFDDTAGSMAEPFEHYRFMRAHTPVLRVRYEGGDFWHICRYSDVRKAARAPKIFASQLETPVPMTFLTLFDSPEHNRLRGAVSSAFNPKSIAMLRNRVLRTGTRLIDEFLDSAGGDFIDKVAKPLTMTTISSLLDVPAVDVDQMLYWSSMLLSVNRRRRGLPGTEKDVEVTAEFLDFIEETLERLYQEESDSVGGHLARLWKSGTLTCKEAREMCAFLFVAGHDTTTFLIGNGVRRLIAQPELLTRIGENPADSAPFIEELARMHGTVHRTTRQTRCEIEIAGYTIPEGALVRLLIASANRDEAKFDEPDVFNIDRDASGHFGFGIGVHSCIGAPLARMEASIAMELLCAKVGRLEYQSTNPIEMASGTGLTVGPVHLLVDAERCGARTMSGQVIQ